MTYPSSHFAGHMAQLHETYAALPFTFTRNQILFEELPTPEDNKLLAALARRINQTGNDHRIEWLSSARESAMDGVWSPDGSRIAFVATMPDAEGPANLFVGSADGANREQITHLDDFRRSCHDPEWSPDGQRTIFRTDMEADLTDPLGQLNGQELFVVELSTGQLTRLTHNNSFDAEPTWRRRP